MVILSGGIGHDTDTERNGQTFTEWTDGMTMIKKKSVSKCLCTFESGLVVVTS